MEFCSLVHSSPIFAISISASSSAFSRPEFQCHQPNIYLKNVNQIMTILYLKSFNYLSPETTLRFYFIFLLQALPNPSTSSFCHRPSRSLHCSHTAFFQLPKWTKLFLITRNLSMCYPHSRMLPPSYLIWLIQISQMLLSQNGLSHLTL